MIERPEDEPSFDVSRVFADLRRLKASMSLKLNKHDLAQVLIAACIFEGINTGKRIVGVLRTLGLNAQHAGMMLKEGTGSDPAYYWWNVDDNGRYSLLQR